MLIDDTENIRTVIVNNELYKTDYIRYQVDINQTLQSLT